VKYRITKYHGIFVMISLLLAGTAQAFNLGNMMNPSKWMGNNNTDDNYYNRGPGYGYGGPGWGGYPGYGYGGPGWGGYPGYGYGGPGWGGYPGYGAPGYGYPGYGAGASPSQGGSTQREIQ
jgi:hypothetical protein